MRLSFPNLTTAASISALILSSVPVVAQQPERTGTDRIHALAEDARARLGLPGLSIAVVKGDRIVFLRGYGMADLENAVLAKPETAYRMASLAKPITAVAVLQLVEEGSVSLDTSIRTYLPMLPAFYEPVTLRDLLRHTGGVRHYLEGEFITTRHCERLEGALQIFADDPLDHPPGEKITYSSYGFTLLGLAIEAVTGTPFSDHVRKRIFEPAGMRATRLDDLAIIPNRAAGYDRSDDEGLRNAPPLDTSCRVPAGGFVSTAEDLARFTIALTGGVLMDTALVREMMRSHLTVEIVARTLAGIELPPGYQPPGMGLGWAVSPSGDRAVYHGGNQPGATTMLYILPERDVAVVLMTNRGGVGDSLTALARTIAEAAAERL